MHALADLIDTARSEVQKTHIYTTESIDTLSGVLQEIEGGIDSATSTEDANNAIIRLQAAIDDLVVVKENIALQAKVTASSESSIWRAENTNDGRYDIVYQSADFPNFPQYLTYIWDEPQNFNSIILYSDYSVQQAPTNFSIEVSDDGTSNWQEIAVSNSVEWIYNDSRLESIEIPFPMQERKKALRLKIQSANLIWNHFQVDEVEIFND